MTSLTSIASASRPASARASSKLRLASTPWLLSPSRLDSSAQRVDRRSQGPTTDRLPTGKEQQAARPRLRRPRPGPGPRRRRATSRTAPGGPVPRRRGRPSRSRPALSGRCRLRPRRGSVRGGTRRCRPRWRAAAHQRRAPTLRRPPRRAGSWRPRARASRSGGRGARGGTHHAAVRFAKRRQPGGHAVAEERWHAWSRHSLLDQERHTIGGGLYPLDHFRGGVGQRRPGPWPRPARHRVARAPGGCRLGGRATVRPVRRREWTGRHGSSPRRAPRQPAALSQKYSTIANVSASAQ